MVHIKKENIVKLKLSVIFSLLFFSFFSVNARPRPIASDAKYGTHMAALITAVANTTGAVLEMGCGDFSTPLLHAICSAEKRFLLSAEDNKQWTVFWKETEGRIIHFIGKDIIYHHSLFWPAMLKAHGEYNLPYKIVAGEYLTLERKKMSKSRGWVITVEDYLRTYDPDPLRYYLIVASPLNKDADFSWSEYIRRNNDELADILGNFIHRSLSFTTRFFKHQIPTPGKLTKEDTNILQIIQETKNEVGSLIESFDFHLALRKIIELAAVGNRYLNRKEPWKTRKTDPENAATTLYLADQIVKSSAILLAPFLPFSAEKIWNFLNLPNSVHTQKWKDVEKPIPSNHLIKNPTPIFKKIDPPS